MRFVKLGAAALLAVWVAGCGGGNGAPVGVAVAPTTATVVLGGSQQLTATVTGTSTTTVTWQVCQPPTTTGGMPVNCGMAGLGTVTSTGLYTAPNAVPSPNSIAVVATSTVNTTKFGFATVTIDSGIRVQLSPLSATVGTSETFTFTDAVTGTSNKAVTWSVNGIAGGNSTLGTIVPTGSNTALYTAPLTPPSPLTITATSGADSSQSGSASLVVVSAADPTLTTLSPSTVAQGSFQQDVYLQGANFLSTSSVLVGGVAVPTTFISQTVLRATVPSGQLMGAGLTNVQVQRQNGDLSPIVQLSVVPVRPAIISSAPDSVSQNQASVSVNLTGGYYSPLATSVQFNGQLRAASFTSSRQLSVALSAGDVATPGLYPVVVQNAGIPAGGASISAVNLAVQPSGSNIPTAALATVAVGAQPSAVAVDVVSGLALVVNTGDNTVSVMDLSSNTIIRTIPVGTKPTGIAVDDQLPHHLALVVNNGDNTVSAIDLTTLVVTPISLPAATTPFSIGVNPLTHRALVANQSTNLATVIDLVNAVSPCATAPCVLPQVGGSANPISTGSNPQVSVDPRLNWAIVTPGGAGAISIVDLGQVASAGQSLRTPNGIATLTLTTSVRGIGFNTETKAVLLTDPNNTNVTVFSPLDDTVSPLVLQGGNVAAAVNSLINVGVAVNSLSATATVIDLQNLIPLQTVAVGNSPVAVAVDPVRNEAIVVNQADGKVSVISLGAGTSAIRLLHVVQSSPATTFTSASPLTLTITGGGFVSGSSAVLLDGQALPAADVSVVSPRQIVATIPSSMLGLARRYIVAVQNPGPTLSNATDLAVIQPVIVGSSPTGVAVDPSRDLAVVTNSADGTVSLVNVLTGTVASTIAVGTNPFGVSVLPRLGLAGVANNGSNSLSILDIVNDTLVMNVGLCGVCSGPEGVSVNQDTAVAALANSLSNTVSFVSLATGTASGNPPVDQNPMATAVDPALNVAAVATASTTSSLQFVNMTTNSLAGRISGLQVPTGVVFDPVSKMFIVANSLQNNILLVDPATLIATPVRLAINPTSLDYNFQTSTLVTVNTASRTMSVVDYLNQKARAILPVSGSPEFSVAIDPRLNLAVVVDQASNRVLLIPLPR